MWVVRDGEQAALGIDSVNVVYGDKGDVIVVVRWNGWKTKIEHLGVRDDIITNSKGYFCTFGAIFVQVASSSEHEAQSSGQKKRGLVNEVVSSYEEISTYGLGRVGQS